MLISKKTAAVGLLCLGLAAATADHSFNVDVAKISWTPMHGCGTFTYAAPNERHGPYNAVEETEILFYTDGPFDFHVDKK
jgi:hypothetical protein